MLVVTRKEKEKVLFPSLGIAVEIVRVSGKAVQVGVEAPDYVRILRAELCNEQDLVAASRQQRELRHSQRNQLNTATLALHLLDRQLATGAVAEAESTLKLVLESLENLNDIQSQIAAEGEQQEPVRHALVVDDNANERELLASYLRLCGYRVDVASDGVEALEFLEQHSLPDVVLLDMRMPRMDGRRTVTAIRKDPRLQGIKVFAVSGEERLRSQIPLGDRGVDRWFSKPLKPDVFAGVLHDELAAAESN